MQLWPAIDLLGGKCVRLQQGDYHRETVFSDDPVSMAIQWCEQGAEYLHLVDLDGAKSGALVNQSAIERIVSAVSIPVQLGGGVRDEEAIKRLLGLGLSRLVLGTAALKNQAWFASMCDRYPGRLVLGIDARNGMVATEGWLDTSTTPAIDLAQQLEKRTSNMAAIVYTDIARDGMLSGPNFEQLEMMLSAVRTPLIASGGVAELEDLRKLCETRVTGCIIGRALYENRFRLDEALRVVGA
ncbi:MAG: 1-(5-phosphoribosyl)-5-[(5-phosphoribosylamino)methylideneamino] imidazole-4-carboxamide isomerase [Planctomycetota bacterium]|jgi:phosphoribosylformimino-5-aminoimidazole carboxamide ribotide isomerase